MKMVVLLCNEVESPFVYLVRWDKCIHNMKGCDCLGAAVVLPEGRSWVSDIPVLGKGQLVTCK